MKVFFKDNNTILIQGWMINNLKLSGNELLIYALIYGFSQDGESEFYGSLNYICSAVNCSKPTTIKVINSLISKGFILKSQITLNGNTFSKYKYIDVNFTPSKETLLVKNVDLGSKETLQGSKETLPNNNQYNNNNSKEQIKIEIFNSTSTSSDLIDNNILKKQTEKKESDRAILFSKSDWMVYENLRANLSKDKKFVEKYKGVDLRHYISKAELWSENNPTKKRTNKGWLLTLRDWMRQAIEKSELKMLESVSKNQSGHINY